jgi:hypothetical protein
VTIQLTDSDKVADNIQIDREQNKQLAALPLSDEINERKLG